jgi:hypothetical protein
MYVLLSCALTSLPDCLVFRSACQEASTHYQLMSNSEQEMRIVLAGCARRGCGAAEKANTMMLRYLYLQEANGDGGQELKQTATTVMLSIVVWSIKGSLTNVGSPRPLLYSISTNIMEGGRGCLYSRHRLH